MTLQIKTYIALAIAAIFAIGIVGGAAWSDQKLATLERDVETAKKEAEGTEQSAIEKEIEAAGYKEKIEYLNGQLTEINTIARKQNEELEKLTDNSRRARGDADRARSTRAINATAAELCAKLAEIGHACH